MEFKKCERCGCFFVSQNNICSNCQPREELETAKLNSYIQNYGNSFDSINDLSVNTGITEKNLYRLLNNNNFLEGN